MNPQKVRLALNELGLPHDIVKVDLGKREQRAPEFPALNPNRKVPVLDDDGFVLWESNAMLAYLGERERRLWPLDARGRADALRWLFFESRHLSEPGGALWFNDFVAPMARIPVDEAARQRGEENLPASLRIIEQHLASSEWMLKDAFSLVDCCYGPLLDALALSRFDLHDYPAVRSYVDRMRGRPAWRQCEFLTARV
jgi:glutathione S-transferase